MTDSAQSSHFLNPGGIRMTEHFIFDFWSQYFFANRFATSRHKVLLCARQHIQLNVYAFCCFDNGPLTMILISYHISHCWLHNQEMILVGWGCWHTGQLPSIFSLDSTKLLVQFITTWPLCRSAFVLIKHAAAASFYPHQGIRIIA